VADVVWDNAALRRLLESEDGEVAKELTRVTIRVHRRAKQLAPVDTGRLRASVTYEVGRDSQGLVALVGTDVSYGPYVELGTRRMSARPFLRPALQAARSGP
jgi:HK97 gp10 family phage protein